MTSTRGSVFGFCYLPFAGKPRQRTPPGQSAVCRFSPPPELSRPAPFFARDIRLWCEQARAQEPGRDFAWLAMVFSFEPWAGHAGDLIGHDEIARAARKKERTAPRLMRAGASSRARAKGCERQLARPIPSATRAGAAGPARRRWPRGKPGIEGHATAGDATFFADPVSWTEHPYCSPP